MRGQLRRRGSGSRDTDIDISPLIDMVFILLIFFVVSTTFVKQAQLDLERPSAQSATTASTKALRVSIDRSERIYVDELPVRPWMIQARVRDFLRQGSSETVLVVVDRNVPSELLIEVVDQCRLAGAQDVGVITDLEDV